MNNFIATAITALEFLINECKGFKIYIDNNMIYATGKNSPERGNWVYGFSLEDLTPEELNALNEEIEAESKGMIILDGVLFHKDKYK